MAGQSAGQGALGRGRIRQAHAKGNRAGQVQGRCRGWGKGRPRGVGQGRSRAS